MIGCTDNIIAVNQRDLVKRFLANNKWLCGDRYNDTPFVIDGINIATAEVFDFNFPVWRRD